MFMLSLTDPKDGMQTLVNFLNERGLKALEKMSPFTP
jgi:hypothetical protein